MSSICADTASMESNSMLQLLSYLKTLIIANPIGTWIMKHWPNFCQLLWDASDFAHVSNAGQKRAQGKIPRVLGILSSLFRRWYRHLIFKYLKLQVGTLPAYTFWDLLIGSWMHLEVSGCHWKYSRELTSHCHVPLWSSKSKLAGGS